jgi:hypothetical protein
VIGGGILLIIGFLFYGGGRAASGDFPLQYARTVSAMDLAERQQQEWTDHVKGYLDPVLFLIAGAISCAMGIIVHIRGV